VVKETLPPSAGEQAESAWLRASRQIEQGRNTEAVASLEAALNLDPGHAPARQSLIALSLEMGDAQRAEALLREGLARFPNDSWYDRALAQITLQRGDTTRAASLLKAGLGKGVDAAYWGFYAGVLKQDGRVAESAQAWREAARLNPAHGPWWLGLAVTLEQSGARPDAAAAYQRALQTRLSPELRDYAAKKAAELATP
jgi:MSHA biogenesis protein MshN